MKSTFPKLLLMVMILLLLAVLLVVPLTAARAAPAFQDTAGGQMTPDNLSTIAGVLLSLGLAYIPNIKDKYDGLDGKGKALVFLALLALGAVANFLLSCAGANITLFGEPTACTANGAIDLANAFIAAMIGGAGAYVALVRPFKQ